MSENYPSREHAELERQALQYGARIQNQHHHWARRNFVEREGRACADEIVNLLLGGAASEVRERNVAAVQRCLMKHYGEFIPLTGMLEELGELAHATLKKFQGIRGTSEEHREAQLDAVGDLQVYGMDFCSRTGMQWLGVLVEVWRKVSKRDWRRDPQRGGE